MAYKRKFRYGGMRGYQVPSASMANRMMAVMNCVEKHYKDVELMDDVAADTAALGNVLSLVGGFNIGTVTAGGPQSEQRTGRKIYITSMAMRLLVTDSAVGSNTISIASTSSIVRYRVVIVKCMNNNSSSTPTAWADLFKLGTLEMDYGDTILRNLEKVDNYKILYDKKFSQLPQPWSTATACRHKPIRKNIFLKFKKPLEICYTQASTTGTQATLTDTDIHLLVWTNDSSDANIFSTTWSLAGRVKFTD